MIDTAAIRAMLGSYLARFPAERDRLARLAVALDDGGAITSRTTFTGHVTCGAVVLDPMWRVLHIRHNALGRWLLPGGHVEPGDPTLIDAALREVTEETGIMAEALSPLAGFEDAPIDIDIHPIPANPGKREPEHMHFDFRYAFTLSEAAKVRLQPEEVSGFDWLALDAVPAGRLGERLAKLAVE